jgi:hypothetical protein
MENLFEMVDINAERQGIEHITIIIKKDGSVLWINTEQQCVLRICQIKNLVIKDERES